RTGGCRRLNDFEKLLALRDWVAARVDDLHVHTQASGCGLGCGRLFFEIVVRAWKGDYDAQLLQCRPTNPTCGVANCDAFPAGQNRLREYGHSRLVVARALEPSSPCARAISKWQLAIS